MCYISKTAIFKNIFYNFYHEILIILTYLKKKNFDQHFNQNIIYLDVKIQKPHFSKVIFLTYFDTGSIEQLRKMIFFNGKEAWPLKV